MTKLRWIAAASAPLAMIALGMAARAQSSSLYGRPAQQRQMTLANSSFTRVQLEMPGQDIKLNSLVTVIVNDTSKFSSEGEVNRRQQSSLDARLRNWLKLDGLGITPAPQSNGEPRARGSLDSTLRTQMQLDSSAGLQFRITARVVDIRPNGLLFIEARKRVRHNEEDTEEFLTGMVRPEDIKPDNTVLSERVAELDVIKLERGHVRDGSRRGWLLRSMDFFKPI